MISNLWSTPIYYSYNKDNDSHNEILKINEQVESNNGFFKVKKESWDKNSVSTTNPDFSSDLLADYNSVLFQTFLRREIEIYLNNLFDDKKADILKVYSFESWLTKTVKGEHLHFHNHAGACISGVYYVQLPESVDYNLNFSSPLKTISSTFPYFSELYNPVKIKCVERMLILFPGWLDHFSFTYESDVPKISFSFNLMFR